MANNTHSASASARREYRQPKLTVFGSVRNLTGGSAGPNGDVMGTFMAMP
ncbi:hypothetical protein [Alteraurantiacibacter aquimixticola]|nr:hypothetical protein [Alteraurantiacibacter aquimixticola]